MQEDIEAYLSWRDAPLWQSLLLGSRFGGPSVEAKSRKKRRGSKKFWWFEVTQMSPWCFTSLNILSVKVQNSHQSPLTPINSQEMFTGLAILFITCAPNELCPALTDAVNQLVWHHYVSLLMVVTVWSCNESFGGETAVFLSALKTNQVLSVQKLARTPQALK